MGNAQLFHWLSFSANLTFGRSIYYDPVNPFSGNSRSFHIDVTIQPSSKLSQALSYERVIFNQAFSGARVYTVEVINTKTTYQFNRHISVRAIERYDSSRKQLLMNYLASYEPVPGTVAYAGYGTLISKQNWDGQEFIQGSGSYINMQRSIFFKLSYLYRF